MKSHKLLRVFSLFCFFATSFSFYSCSDLETEGGKVNLSFDTTSLFGSRNISLSSDGENNACYIVVSVRGDYNTVQSDLIYVDFDNPPTSHSMSFDSVPVGNKVYLDANVYAPWSSEYLHMHTGKSGTILVVSGENSVKIKMTDLTKDSEMMENKYCGAVLLPNSSEPLSQTPHFVLYANGKYQLRTESYKGVYVFSEGIWRYSGSSDLSSFVWDSEEPYTLYLTEYICSGNASIDEDECLIASNPIIVEYPEEKSFYLGENPKNFSFTSASGIYYSTIGSY